MIFGEGGSAAPSRRWKDFNAYFAQLLQPGHLDQHRHLRRLEPDLDLGARREGRSAHARGTRPDARAGEGGDGAGRARCGQFAERTAGLVDRHRHAGRHVRGGRRATAASTPPTCAPKAAASSSPSPRPSRSAGARERAGRHHPPQDRRARDVGPDARADRLHRRGARARPGRAGQRLSLPRRAEQSLQHHPAVGARRRRRRR